MDTETQEEFLLTEDEREAIVETIISARFEESNLFQKEEFHTLALTLQDQRARDLVIWEMCRLKLDERNYVFKTLKLMTENVTMVEAPHAWSAYAVALWIDGQTPEADTISRLILKSHPLHKMSFLIAISIQTNFTSETFIETMNSMERDQVSE